MLIVAILSLIGGITQCTGFRMTTRQRTKLNTLHMNSAMAKEHTAYLTDVARVKPPKRLQALLELIELQDVETLISPTDRKGLNPFLIPLARNKRDGSRLCYIRWPTQKDEMEMQLCRTTDVGVVLVALGTDQYAHRLACEMDFYCTPTAPKAVEILNRDGQLYTTGAYIDFLKSGKFPSLTDEDLKLVLDRYLLTKVGAFPDCYERLANNFIAAKNEVSALVTCERAVSVFYGWGHPVAFHARALSGMADRMVEARDAARSALGMPAWTVGKTREELEALALLAGFTGCAILGEMHAFRAKDPRTDDIGEGMSQCQVTLDQAAHLMDAVAFGHIEGGWDSVKDDLIVKYREGGYPEISMMIQSVLI